MYKLTHKQYFEALKDNKLLGLKCNDCGSYTVPPKICCDNCGSFELKIKELSGKGIIKTFTVIRVSPEGLKAPYVIALVELDEGPWLMGNVINVDPDGDNFGLINKAVTLGHRVVNELNYTSGEGVTPIFNIDENI